MTKGTQRVEERHHEKRPATRTRAKKTEPAAEGGTDRNDRRAGDRFYQLQATIEELKQEIRELRVGRD